ncbi:MAG: hypothetical protein B7X04_03185 [Parcubacteria group bacterium 21-54-25]|nr:MAG: hypothetical protein B7X04_03185 [Parcubacteria group bacterium 21-54-25]HQU07993.1 phosphatase PAP2-related protein [Candidatus Paceibacterota bacterium]
MESHPTVPTLPPQRTGLFRRAIHRWHDVLALNGFRSTLIISALALIASFGINLAAIAYATERASNTVTDIILSNVPLFDVDRLFVYGTFLFAGFVVIFLLTHPKYIPFTLNSLALFWVIRAGFTTLTHIAPYPTHASTDFGTTITKMFFGGDLFFSGHTGMPFLLALIFWKWPRIRYTFLFISIAFAFIVLLGHLHYSIDVFGAYFITYTIYCLCLKFFPRTYAIFTNTELETKGAL